MQGKAVNVTFSRPHFEWILLNMVKLRRNSEDFPYRYSEKEATVLAKIAEKFEGAKSEDTLTLGLQRQERQYIKALAQNASNILVQKTIPEYERRSAKSQEFQKKYTPYITKGKKTARELDDLVTMLERTL